MRSEKQLPCKAELKCKGETYTQLVEKLAEIRVDEKEVNVRNELSRGKITAAFFLQCLEAIGGGKSGFKRYFLSRILPPIFWVAS